MKYEYNLNQDKKKFETIITVLDNTEYDKLLQMFGSYGVKMIHELAHTFHVQNICHHFDITLEEFDRHKDDYIEQYYLDGEE